MTATIIVAIIGAVSSFLVVLITKYRERIAVIEQDNRQRKIPVYEEILNAIGSIVRALSNNQKPPATPELTQKVATWASTKVFVLYLGFCSECEKDNPSMKDLNQFLFSMILAIREDLGHKAPVSFEADYRDAIGAFIIHDYARQAAQQLVESERRERVSQLDSSGDA